MESIHGYPSRRYWKFQELLKPESIETDRCAGREAIADASLQGSAVSEWCDEHENDLNQMLCPSQILDLNVRAAQFNTGGLLNHARPSLKRTSKKIQLLYQMERKTIGDQKEFRPLEILFITLSQYTEIYWTSTPTNTEHLSFSPLSSSVKHQLHFYSTAHDLWWGWRFCICPDVCIP